MTHTTGIPVAEARLHILNVPLAKTPHNIPPIDLQALAARAHVYVGADISAMVREAGTIAIKRWLSMSPSQSIANSSMPPTLELKDLVAAMPFVRPSAMRPLFVETPPVRYGGQSTIIQWLREVVEWSLLHPEAFQRLSVKPLK